MTGSETITELIRFGALLVHQIKNPLTSLMLQIDELSEQLTNSKLVKVTQEALSEINQINQMIEQIFDLWKLSLSHELEAFDLTALTRTSVEKWREKFERQNRNINLVAHENIFALGCAQLEDQVIDILIANSLNYGAGETVIKVDRNNSWAVLTIKDEGFGIDPKIKDKILTYGATTSGNGVGLVWAKNQATQDGGKLEIISMNPAIFSLSLHLDPTNYGLNPIEFR